jgi:hypothetical protein
VKWTGGMAQVVEHLFLQGGSHEVKPQSHQKKKKKAQIFSVSFLLNSSGIIFRTSKT